LIVLVVVETLLLALLTLLVAGLLRSHAEILRRLPRSVDEPPQPTVQQIPGPHRDAAPASDIVGVSLDGDPVKVAVAGGTPGSLVAFLSSGCATCQSFWDALRPEVRRPLPGGSRLILVTRDSSHESPSKLRELAPRDVPLVMSSAAWQAYEVPLTPYFVYVDGPSGLIQGEGAAEAWPQVISLLGDALSDAEVTGPALVLPGANGGRSDSRVNPRGSSSRFRRADDELRAAGIAPGHPSLYEPGDPGTDA
jgi:hypothetical protein